MALLTVERMQSVEGSLSSSSEEDEHEEEDDKCDDMFDSPRPRPPKLGRMRSPSFAGYFASKGGAVSLADGNKSRTATDSHEKPCGELQDHLQRMVAILREEDALKMAVRIESQLPDKKRYLTAVTNSNGECILVGIDWASGPTIGLVLELNSTTTTKLDGDGGFHITYESGRTHCFKPVSVQTLWSAIHIIQRGVAMATQNGPHKGYTEFLSFYKSRINSDVTSISEWNMMDDLESTRQFDLVTSDQQDSEDAAVRKKIRAKLKEVMVKVDIDEVTSREIRQMCEKELGISLSQYKSYLDQEMFTILGQMDSASEIFDYLYLGSEWNASDLEELKNLQIGYILNLTREIDNFFPDTFVYDNIRVWDEEDTELLQYWDRTYKFIHSAKMAGSKVLVHCRRGISRSASTVIAYIMKSTGKTLKECMELVKERRSIVNPNAGFQKQLIIYEGILNSSRNRYSALFRERSKSDVLRPSQHERRNQFKRARHSEEVDEEDNENNNEDFQYKSTNRPRSWAPGSSGMNFDSAVDPQKYVTDATAKNKEMPPLKEDVEDENSVEKESELGIEEKKSSVEGSEVNVCEAGTTGATKVQNKRRLLARARTLPPQSAPRHWEEISQKEAIYNDSRPLTEAEERKEDDLFEQAVAASVMKRQLMQSLVKLQELRGEEDTVGSKLALESIIKPSSLRKASASRRMPFERTRSFSGDRNTIRSQGLRERSYTIGPTKCFPSYDYEDDPDESSKSDEGKTDETETKDFIGEPDTPAKNGEEKSGNSPVIEATHSNGSNSNIIETSQFQTVKQSTKWYEGQGKSREPRIRILRKPRRHTIDSSELLDKIKREESSISRSKSSEGRAVSRGQSPSPETIRKHRMERSANCAGKKFLTVENAADYEILCQKDPSISDLADTGKQNESEDDLSVRKLVKKHSDLIRNNSPPCNLDSSSSHLTSASSIGENLISTSIALNDKNECSSNNVSSSCASTGNSQEDLKPDLKSDSNLKPADIVQPGLVKRQSQLFSRLDSDKGQQSLDKSTITPGNGSVEDKNDYADKETTEYHQEDGTVQLQRSKRGCVKELLRQMEGKVDVKTQHPSSCDSQAHDKHLDTEVESFMHLHEDDSGDSRHEAHTNLPNDLQTGGQMLVKPKKDISKARSAPVSPKLPRAVQPRASRSSSLGNSTQISATYSDDTHVRTEDVKSLVDRFEIGDLTS